MRILDLLAARVRVERGFAAGAVYVTVRTEQLHYLVAPQEGCFCPSAHPPPCAPDAHSSSALLPSSQEGHFGEHDQRLRHGASPLPLTTYLRKKEGDGAGLRTRLAKAVGFEEEEGLGDLGD